MLRAMTTSAMLAAAALVASWTSSAAADPASKLAAAEAEPLYADPQLGQQMTVAEIKRDVVGNSWSWVRKDVRSFQYIAPDGTLRGGNDSGKRYLLHWRFRDYDNLFCLESGDPASSGCVQLLRQGPKVSFRRKDGVVELTATIAPGNSFGL